MARYTLEQLANMEEVQPFQKDGWTIYDGLSPITYDGRNWTLPSYLIQSVDVSQVKFDSIAIDTGPTKTYYPGNNDVGGPSITVYENINMDATNYFNAWLGSIQNADGTYNMPSSTGTVTASGSNPGFKKSFRISLNDCTGKQLKLVKCIGCWPEGGYQYGFDDTQNAMTLTIQLAMDSLAFEDPVVEYY